MSRKVWGLGAPFILTLAGCGVVVALSISPSNQAAIMIGFAIAFLQSMLSTLALDWSWDKKYVYWVWAGGMLFRMAVLAVTAAIVHKFTSLSLVGTLIPMILATTLFLVFESYLFFSKRKS